jgi:hypothetical protein
VLIGSRNHPDDIMAHVEASDEWDKIVETAHSYECDLPVEDLDAHTDCVLWPKVRTYRYLMSQMRDIGEAKFRLRYLNDARSEGVTLFTEQSMRECIDRSRVFGQLDLPPGYELLGSIDPSPGLHQVCQLWAWSYVNPGRYLIDCHKGKGGMDAWQDIQKLWLKRYSLRRWVVEANSSQADYVNKREIVQWRHDNGVVIHEHTTGRNKHMLGIGVASMVPLYTAKNIVLPYGGGETQGMVDQFIREHVNYDPDRTSHQSGWRIDQVVTAWFAHLYVDNLRRESGVQEPEESIADWMLPDDSMISADPFEGWLG